MATNPYSVILLIMSVLSLYCLVLTSTVHADEDEHVNKEKVKEEVRRQRFQGHVKSSLFSHAAEGGDGEDLGIFLGTVMTGELGGCSLAVLWTEEEKKEEEEDKKKSYVDVVLNVVLASSTSRQV